VQTEPIDFKGIAIKTPIRAVTNVNAATTHQGCWRCSGSKIMAVRGAERRSPAVRRQWQRPAGKFRGRPTPVIGVEREASVVPVVGMTGFGRLIVEHNESTIRLCALSLHDGCESDRNDEANHGDCATARRL
jgi:hypothetical protein